MSTFADASDGVAAANKPNSTSTPAAAESNATASQPTKAGSESELPAANGTGGVLEDGYPADLEIPVRYVKGMDGDMVEARRRWIESLKVRVCVCVCFPGYSYLHDIRLTVQVRQAIGPYKQQHSARVLNGPIIIVLWSRVKR